MITVEKVTSGEGIKRLAAVWNPLLAESASNTLSLTFEWLTVWWEVFGTVRWGIICHQQAWRHLSGAVKSMELASIGRRAVETEVDVAFSSVVVVDWGGTRVGMDGVAAGRGSAGGFASM